MLNFLIILGLITWFIINLILVVCYVIVVSNNIIESSILYWLTIIFGHILIYISWYWLIYFINIY